jgi:exodeoxyribonuclease VII large subunit
VDVTIADLVADARASTPSQAGVIAVPDFRDELHKLYSLKRRLHLNIRSRMQHSKNRIDTVLASRIFRSPLGPVQVATQRLDELMAALNSTTKALMTLNRQHLDRMGRLVGTIEPTRLIAKHHIVMSEYKSRNRVSVMKILNRNQLKLTALENTLQALNPRSVLKRGYSLTTNERNGELVTKLDQVQVGDRLITELAEKQKIHSCVDQIGSGSPV